MRTWVEQVRRWSGTIAASGVLACAGVGAVLATATPSAEAAFVTAAAEPLDTIVLRNGREIKGRIESETPTEVRIVVVYAGIEAPTSYPRDEILSIVRAVRTDAADGAPEATETTAPVSRRSSRDDRSITALSGDQAPSVFHVRLAGDLGTDIAVAPVRDALEASVGADTDSYGNETAPDYLIIELDRLWADAIGQDLGDDVANFDEFSIGQEIIDVIIKEMPKKWDRQPHIVVWVKSAMGGAAFIPFVADSMVFHPEGRMGGVGNLGQLAAGVGDEVVRQKQRSLRLARAQGIAIEGGYDYRLVTAMTMSQYELSYRLNGGVAELFERTPLNPGEILLTEDGTDPGNIDSLRQRVTGTGNDWLTLREEAARHLGVSKGTAETLDDVLDVLGIFRDHRMLDNRSDRLMANWSRSLKRAERELPKMWREYNEINVGGTYQESRRALGRRIRMLEDIKGMINRFNGEAEYPALIPQRLGVPTPENLNVLIEQNRVQLIQLRP